MIPEIAKRYGLDLLHPADALVAKILDDVTSRSGWDGDWDQFDREVRLEIVARWKEIVRTSPRQTLDISVTTFLDDFLSSDNPDFLDLLLAEGEAQHPGFTQKVDEAYARRLAKHAKTTP